MPHYPPGFFLNPHNWALVPQRSLPPAYPWTPSEESVRWSTIDRGYPDATQANVARGLLDFAEPGTTATGILDIAPADPTSNAHGVSAEHFRGAAPQYTRLRTPFDGPAANGWQALLPAGAMSGPPVMRPPASAHLGAGPAFPFPGQAQAMQQAFGGRDILGAAPQYAALTAPVTTGSEGDSDGHDSRSGKHRQEQAEPGEMYGGKNRAYAQAGFGEDQFGGAGIDQSQFRDMGIGWSEQVINQDRFNYLVDRSGPGLDDPSLGFAYPVRTSDPNVIFGATNYGGLYTNGPAVMNLGGSYRLLRPNPGETLIINPGRGIFGPSIRTTTYKGS